MHHNIRGVRMTPTSRRRNKIGLPVEGLTNLDVQTLCVAWRQALRRILKLPYSCHTAILERLCGPISMFDTLCKRSLNFVQKCLSSENVLVNFVFRHAVLYSRMCSGMGQNDKMCSFIVNDFV